MDGWHDQTPPYQDAAGALAEETPRAATQPDGLEASATWREPDMGTPEDLVNAETDRIPRVTAPALAPNQAGDQQTHLASSLPTAPLALYTEAPHAPQPRVTSGPRSAPPPPPSVATSGRAPKRRLTGWRRNVAFAIVILLCSALGFSGVYGAITIPDALRAARDAKAQAQAIEALIKGGHLTDVATLTTLGAHLQALDADLGRIKSDIPGGPVASAVASSSLGHALTMGQDLTAAGLYAVDAGLAITPHIKDILGSVTGSASGKAGGGPGALTAADISRATADVETAGRYATLALAERARVSDSDLSALGFGSFVGLLHKLDAVAPQLPTYLGYGQNALAALPDLLGLTKPVNYLLLDLDSDELRPTGGFQGVYGILNFKGARLTGGVHLQNIYSLDCRGGFPPNCPIHPLPAAYHWFTYPDGLRNANLDPDYPATARLDERMLGVDLGPAVAGVISLTPFVIQQALALTGAVTVPGYPQKITAQNFSELIHYYHSILGSNNVSKSKAFDAAAGGALLKAVGRLSASDQAKLMQDAIADLRTGDLQVYLNDARVESTLAALHLDGALRAPSGDTFAVINANHGANYANADVAATESDKVVINAQGGATHTLTITYKFPVKKHQYTPALVSVYHDFIQVLAPPRARLQSIRGCARINAQEPGWADFACDMTLWRGGTANVVFQWVTPNATIPVSGGATQYNLLVQRQSGTHDGLGVFITLPSGARVSQPLAPGLSVANGQVRYGASLTQDLGVSLTWRS